MTYTKKQLAEIAGYTYRRLHDIDMGLPEDGKLFVKSEDGKYDLALFVQRWVEYNISNETGGELSLDEVRARHEQVKTEKTRLQVARLRGELVEIEAVRKAWGDVANTVMQNMIRLPSKIAPQIVMMENVEIITGIIDKEIRDALISIAETPVPADEQEKDGDEADSEEE